MSAQACSEAAVHLLRLPVCGSSYLNGRLLFNAVRVTVSQMRQQFFCGWVVHALRQGSSLLEPVLIYACGQRVCFSQSGLVSGAVPLLRRHSKSQNLSHCLEVLVRPLTRKHRPSKPSMPIVLRTLARFYRSATQTPELRRQSAPT